ncbi:MAG: ASCH domain-containing protein [Nitrosopumilus sp.]|nr:ASCH domain-containing protein [Nitrosopumilus sp.]MDH3516768.1 ASCH domain-containing protein [Nitrosopumilus sp.]MDH3565600.1 ASCH domain-containing protein [Nitrosopumilus sp.]MDH5417605.1 ASCH domain-containing protein [Nitrosopumilus sp.]MDH5555675.1 ASCH domain-containing protein [Nitrosopumilus sp.]
MKCLSVAQPFADLIISGEKTIELRNWSTNFRGEFLIHSPLKIRRDDCIRLKMDKKFVTGAIIGKAEIYDIKKYNSLKEIKLDKKFHLSSKKFQNKTYGFMLRNPKSFRIPVPQKGQLGLFDFKIPKIKNRDIITDIMDKEHSYQLIGHH